MDRDSRSPAREVDSPPVLSPRTPIVASERPRVVLHPADCLAGMRQQLADGSVDVVVTSPPYNIGIRYSTYRDKLPRVDYLTWIAEVGREVARVLGPSGHFFLNVGNKPSDPWIAWDVASALRETLRLQNVIHWVKAISIEGETGVKLSVGHYKPINSERFLNDAHELVFHFTRDGEAPVQRLAIGVPYQDKTNIARWAHTKKKDLRCRGNVWFCPYETIQRRDTDRPHPATFPVKLAEMALKLAGAKRGSLVLDPFMGIGSTAVAAARLGADCVGFDVDDGYLELAAKRVRDELAHR